MSRGEGGVAFRGFLEYSLAAADGAMPKDSLELHGLMRRRPVDRKDGPLSGRISKHLICGKPNARDPSENRKNKRSFETICKSARRRQ